MIETLEAIIPYITGLWTLPWILVGFIITIITSRLIGEEKTNKTMKKVGLVILYIFVPSLLFRIFLDVDFGRNEIMFSIVCVVILFFMYILAYCYANYQAKKQKLKENDKKLYIKTVLTNQGRSSAFVGGAMLAISEWRVIAAIYMSIGAIFLFAIIPYILSHLHKKELTQSEKTTKIKALPLYLKIFPWYLLIFAMLSVTIHGATGVYLKDFGDIGTVFKFFTALTIPAALYYVGAGIHPSDLIKDEMKKLFSIKQKTKKIQHWQSVRNIFFLTTVITPLLTAIFLILLLILNLVPKEWFAVIVINSILPITSTNMFLVPYGIDKKITAQVVTWTTIVCVPIIVFLIYIFNIYL